MLQLRWCSCLELNLIASSSLLTHILHFNDHFPGEPGLAGVYWSKGWRRWWWQLDYWSYKLCKAPVKSHHQQTNIQFFTGRMPFLSPNQQCQSTEGKYQNSWTCLPKLTWWVFQLCLWPLISPGYLWGVLPCLSSALWCQYPMLTTDTNRFKQLLKYQLFQVAFRHFVSAPGQFVSSAVQVWVCICIHIIWCCSS